MYRGRAHQCPANPYRSDSGATGFLLMSGQVPGSGRPRIADHEVLRHLARGTYGSVWLVQSVLGRCRAAKVVERRAFASSRQYEREWTGVRHFEPISRTHPGFVHILQVGRCPDDTWFYYVMELADDLHRMPVEDCSEYVPRTLRAELDRRRRLPVLECVLVARTLLLALQVLHHRGLVHRDMKPANIIYVDGVPKLADIGTVATQQHGGTSVGSVGYHPPEGSGRPAGDIFSMGRILYEMFSGVAVQELADNLPDLTPRLKNDVERRFYQIIQRSCSFDPRQRPASAAALEQELAALCEG